MKKIYFVIAGVFLVLLIITSVLLSFRKKSTTTQKNSPQAEEEFINWASQNQLAELIESPELTLFVDLGKNPDDFNPVIEFLNIFMSMGQGSQQLDNGTIEQPSQSS